MPFPDFDLPPAPIAVGARAGRCPALAAALRAWGLAPARRGPRKLNPQLQSALESRFQLQANAVALGSRASRASTGASSRPSATASNL